MPRRTVAEGAVGEPSVVAPGATNAGHHVPAGEPATGEVEGCWRSRVAHYFCLRLP